MTGDTLNIFIAFFFAGITVSIIAVTWHIVVILRKSIVLIEEVERKVEYLNDLHQKVELNARIIYSKIGSALSFFSWLNKRKK